MKILNTRIERRTATEAKVEQEELKINIECTVDLIKEFGGAEDQIKLLKNYIDTAAQKGIILESEAKTLNKKVMKLK